MERNTFLDWLQSEILRTRDHAGRASAELLGWLGWLRGLLHDSERDLLSWLDAHRWDPARPERVGYEVVDLPAFTRLTSAHPQPYADRKGLEDARAAAWRKAHPNRNAPPAVLIDGVL